MRYRAPATPQGGLFFCLCTALPVVIRSASNGARESSERDAGPGYQPRQSQFPARRRDHSRPRLYGLGGRIHHARGPRRDQRPIHRRPTGHRDNLDGRPDHHRGPQRRLPRGPRVLLVPSGLRHRWGLRGSNHDGHCVRWRQPASRRTSNNYGRPRLLRLRHATGGSGRAGEI